MAQTYDRRINLYINGREIKNDLASIQKEMYKATNELRRMTIGSDEYNRKAAEVKKLKTIYNEHQQQLRATTSLMSKFGGLLPVLSGAAILGGLKSLAGSIINVRREFEKYEAILTNSLGSQKSARTELQMLQEFASKTPYSLQELTGSFVKLTNYGLKPSREELVKYGDLSSSVGKSFEQLTEALADAVTGEFERLKEFGIKAKKEGDKITFTFKEQSTVVDYTSESIKNYIQSLGELEGVAGSMEAISKTLEGRISNLGDAWDNFLNKLGSGASAPLGRGLDSITTDLNDWGKLFDLWSSDRVSKWNKFLSSISYGRMNKEWDRLQAEMKKAAENEAAGADIQNLFGVSTAGDLNPTFVKTDKSKGKTPAQIAAEEKAKEEALKLAEKQKNELDALTKKATKALIPEKDETMQTKDWMTVDTWDIEADKLDARKAREEEWTKFLTDQIEFRANAEAKAFEMEKSIAEARADLKDMQVEVIGQVASSLANMFEQGSAAQIAMIAIEKAVAIAQIWINYAREMSAINLASANLAAQPWPGARTAALAYWVTMSTKAKTQAAVNTGIVAATAIASGISSGKREKKQAYAAGGFTNGARTYIAGEAGTEWIAPNWMTRRLAPTFAALEQVRLNPAALQTLSSGGFAGTSGAVSPPLLSGGVAAGRGGIDAATAQNLTTAINNLLQWQPSVAVETFERKKQQYNKIQNTRGL